MVWSSDVTDACHARRAEVWVAHAVRVILSDTRLILEQVLQTKFGLSESIDTFVAFDAMSLG